MWDADQYLRYAGERARPFFDLVAQVRRERVSAVADLGCGPGTLTRTLLERWPEARVVGVDNSPQMLREARKHAVAGRLDFIQADLSRWEPTGPLDLVVSNAALQWVPDHEALLPRLVAMLSPGGVLAVQVPNHFREPSHRLIAEAATAGRWSAALAGVGLSDDAVKPVDWYVRRLRELGCAVDAWETTYVHVLTGDDPVLEWMKGTALRPMLDRLGPEAGEFLAELAPRMRSAYPAEGGVTLFPFRRLFFVAGSPAPPPATAGATAPAPPGTRRPSGSACSGRARSP